MALKQSSNAAYPEEMYMLTELILENSLHLNQWTVEMKNDGCI